ncbi:MAG: hypothetical protein LUG85_08365 [Clostridiales bacterium]|nr:hypothetical protein [Clostridiales bacterium]MCD7828525.1 hypothetical protein [Clostridiales bacterium]
MESDKKSNSTEDTNCIHLTKTGECGILRVKVCGGKSCSFCETETENDSAAKSWRNRLCSMDEGLQSKIAGTYYGGKKPWLAKDDTLLKL